MCGRALAISGVRAVITAADIPRAWYGPAVKDMTALADGRVRYIGEPIAAVAATSEEIAERAVAAIEAAFDPLPAVFDPEAALAQEAPLLHPDWAGYTALPVLARDGNVASHSRIHHGDVEAAFSTCFRVYEHRFTTPSVHAGYTEPRAATARWEGDGSLTVWSNGQLPYEVQATLADILQLPVSRIRVLVPGHRRRVWRQAAHLAGALCRLAGAGGAAAGEDRFDLRGGTHRRASTAGFDHHAAYRCRPRWDLARETGARGDGLRRLCRIGPRHGRGGVADRGGSVSDAQPATGWPGGVHEQGAHRIVPRDGWPDGQLRDRIADGHHRR